MFAGEKSFGEYQISRVCIDKKNNMLLFIRSLISHPALFFENPLPVGFAFLLRLMVVSGDTDPEIWFLCKWPERFEFIWVWFFLCICDVSLVNYFGIFISIRFLLIWVHFRVFAKIECPFVKQIIFGWRTIRLWVAFWRIGMLLRMMLKQRRRFDNLGGKTSKFCNLGEHWNNLLSYWVFIWERIHWSVCLHLNIIKFEFNKNQN